MLSLNADTAACTKTNYVVPGPSSVAAAIATRAALRVQDVEPKASALTLTTPTTDGDTVKYSQTQSALG